MNSDSPSESLTPPSESKVAHSALARAGWFALGWCCVALGGVGVVVPGLPSTGFFVGAAGCFSRSSPRFERWVLNLPGVGPLVRDYRAGLGMPLRAKKTALIMMWLAIGLSAGFIIGPIVIRLVVVALGLVGSWVIVVQTPTKPEPASP